MSFLSTVKQEVKGLSPAYFALVMATGIVSLGANMLGFPTVSEMLFWANNVVFAILLLLLLSRILFFYKRFIADLTSFKKAAGFFSLVAGTCILGVQYVQQKQSFAPASVLFWFGLGTWVLLIYAFFLMTATKSDKPSLKKGISGVWLLIVVATQSIAILGTLLTRHLPFPPEQVLFFTLSMWLLGLMLYVILITLIVYRLTFFPTTPREITPPYWVNEGAVGITALAGAFFMQHISSTTGFTGFLPFIKGISLLAWATATWWIPVIVLLEIWKYLIKKTTLKYTPKYWALVFCVGGYTVATFKLSKTLSAPYLQPIPELFIYISFAVWAIVLLGMCLGIVKAFTAGSSKSEG
ncbi:tellurite resistance protein TehA-like permease [Pontibacter ummariensis]|uniref:Tellurite resistance protein TehA n=1 Tax=Pontibacter ummariensis TaxID=1610492 RepID=A0A239DBN1_9BACT|nr:tellurite resistance/C4-dicarboxylate transporter family protein [Pontibacter ummariensis]PRY14326.1 tellurite resistance protein TehA-like permease [Pontibacter ummariensis]SNS29261.1 Tellurite resistance protein TehA [Pontibacter ummariensis]